MSELIARASGAWWAWMAPTAWQVLGLAALIWMIDRCTRRKLWTEIRIALWLLVIARLAIPPSWSSPASVMALARGIAPAPASSMPSVEGLASAHESSLPITALAFALWIAGVGACAVLEVRRRRRFAHELATDPQPVRLPTEVLAALARAARRMDVARVPPLAISRRFVCPAVFGVSRPCIVLPASYVVRAARGAGSRDTHHLEHALLHELAHVRRRDLLTGAIVRAMAIVFWFHPAVWLAQRELAALREIACDATVASRLRERTREYRDALLDSARALVDTRPEPHPSFAELWHAPSTLLVRLEALERPLWKFARRRRLASASFFALAVVLVLPAAPSQELDIAESARREARSPVLAHADRSVPVRGADRSSSDGSDDLVDRAGDVEAALANLQRFAEGGARQSCLRLQYSAMLIDTSGAIAALPRE